MRIVHTSDWHAGRRWHRLDRDRELAEVLGSLCRYVESEPVDLVLITGDQFDTVTPPTRALKLVIDVLVRLGRQAPTVVIAGNHDSAEQLEALGQLTKLANVHALGHPRSAGDGGVLRFTTAAGEPVVVAALPFARTRSMVSALERQRSDFAADRRYDAGMRAMVAHLCAEFRPDAVNLLLIHTHLFGAQIAQSERPVHVGAAWAADARALPDSAHYVAMGHIHKPQQIEDAASPACYAGSPLQLDFGEEGQDKSFVVIEAEPGRPATLTRVPYEGGRRVRTWQGSLDDLQRDAEILRSCDEHVRIELQLDSPQANVNALVRELVPNTVLVRVHFPIEEEEEESEQQRPTTMALDELFDAYHQGRYGAAAPEGLAKAFSAIYTRASERQG